MVFPAAQEVYVHIAPPRLPRVRLGRDTTCVTWGMGLIGPLVIQNSNANNPPLVPKILGFYFNQ